MSSQSSLGTLVIVMVFEALRQKARKLKHRRHVLNNQGGEVETTMCPPTRAPTTRRGEFKAECGRRIGPSGSGQGPPRRNSGGGLDLVGPFWAFLGVVVGSAVLCFCCTLAGCQLCQLPLVAVVAMARQHAIQPTGSTVAPSRPSPNPHAAIDSK